MQGCRLDSGQGAKIPYVLREKPKKIKKTKKQKQKQYFNKFNKDLKEEKKKLISTHGSACPPESMDLADASDPQR